MQLARRASLLLLAASATVGCARQCGGMGGGPPVDLPEVVGLDGVKRRLLDKGVYKAWYDNWGRLEKIEFDKNGDGNPDHLAHYGGGRSARLLEVDEDYNGTMDRWEYYDEAGALVEHNLVVVKRAQYDTAEIRDGDEIEVSTSSVAARPN